ncbi:MAG: hypothetical protein ACK5JH_17085 [Anaerocolumna sp.]
MEELLLNDPWKMKINGQNIYDIKEIKVDATVPGSVYGTLVDLKLIPEI